MRADLDEHGVLIISGDTLIERIALGVWHESWLRREARLRVVIATPLHEQVEVDPPSRPSDELPDG